MIELCGLRYDYPDGTPALKGIDLVIPDGEFLLVCGPNGSGKTTLIRLLKGLISPASGSIRLDGADIFANGQDALRRIGIVFQDADAQIVGETVREDVAFGPENLGLSPEEIAARVSAALRTVGLERLAEKPCHRLSGGEKRRVAIAGALAMESDILILDEPFANLDYPGVCQVLAQIVALHRAGHTIVLTTHDVEKAATHADRIVVLHDGEIKASGSLDSVVADLPLYGIRPPCYHLFGMEAVSWLVD